MQFDLPNFSHCTNLVLPVNPYQSRTLVSDFQRESYILENKCPERFSKLSPKKSMDYKCLLENKEFRKTGYS